MSKLCLKKSKTFSARLREDVAETILNGQLVYLPLGSKPTTNILTLWTKK